MNQLTKRISKSAILLLISVLILTCTVALGVAAEGTGETYTLKLEVTFYDELGYEWPVGNQTELAAGDVIDADALIASLKQSYPHLADTVLSAEGILGLPADGKMPAADLTISATLESRPFTVIWVVDGVEVIDTVAYGKIPVFTGSTDKASDAQYSYTFTGWDKELAEAYEDATYVARYESTLNEYTVTWDVAGVITTETYKYGETPSFKGSTDKASDAQYTYTFAGWDSPVNTVVGDVTYVAQYETILNEYTVTWIVDGVTTTETYKYGETPSFKGSTDKAADAQFTYTFIGWDSPVNTVVGDVTYVAQYETAANGYTVTWDVAGVITTETYKYGETPSFKGSTDKAADAQFTYTFIGWDKPLDAVAGDVTYVAQYETALNEYTVTWDVAGVITTETYKFGETPSFKGSTDKAATAQYTYTFAGWDKTIATVEGDVTYTAQYTETVNEYTVTWIVDGVTTTETYKYGETPSFKGSTDKAATAQYTYTFAGWDKTLAAVEGDVTYTAQYTETVNEYTVTWIVDGKETTAQVPYGTVPGFGSTPSKPAAGGYSYIFKGWDKEIVAVTGDVTYTAVFEASANEVTITFKVDGQADVTVVVKVGETPAYPNGTPSKAADAQYTYTFKGWDKEIAAATEDATYTAQFDTTVRKYYVYFYYGHNTVLPLIVEYGQAAQAPTNTDKAPTASTVYTFDGWDVDFSNVTGDMKVYAKYTESVRTYTVTFNYGDGKTETVTVEYGKGATAPTDTDKAATEEYTYTFKGWDADFSEITADLTVNAQYEEIPVKEPETETTEPDTDPVEPDTNEPETDPETAEPETDPETAPETTPETDPETTTPDETETEVPGTDGCGNTWIWIVLVIVIVGAGAAVVIILLRRKNAADPEPTEPKAAPAAEPEAKPEVKSETAPLFIPVGEEIPEEEIPEEVETVEEVAATDVDNMMTDKAAAAFLVTSDEEGGQGKMGIINVGLISTAYQAGETVDLTSLQEKGMIDANVGRLKVLASGTLDKPLIIKADAFSVQAVKMITLTGGQAIELKGE